MTERVRVRFAPSPTGELHLGNARTALFNWLFARHNGGGFVLRVEDTDAARSTEGAERSILEGLRWLGLEWDEGPKEGGKFGPYRQSDRLAIYRSHAEQLLREERAYRCYCSAERLDEMRQGQRRRGEAPGYDGRCRRLSEVEAKRLESQGIEPVIRFKTPVQGETSFLDLLRGSIGFANDSLDDFVLLKSDGYPTYHLANVVDDHLMEVSHVLRADEWIPSTPRHVLLYQAFSWAPPHFIHLPLILDQAGGKLSKRQGNVSVDVYRQAGYLPEAVVNYLALLGWSPGDTQEILDLEELVSKFSWERITTSPAIFDLERLNWFNKWYIRESSTERIAQLVAPYLAEAYGKEEHSEGTVYSPRAWIELLVESVREEVDSLGQMPAHVAFAFLDELAYTGKAAEALRSPQAGDVLSAFAESVEPLESLDLSTAKAVLQRLRALMKERMNLRPREVLFPVRASLTGTVHGPDLAVVLALLGRDRCVQRIASLRNSFLAS
jgi:nondiscriminating glutamyl-tRNA synthetase